MRSYISFQKILNGRFFNIIYYYLVSAMFIPFSVLMLPLAIQANTFHIDNLYGIVVLYVLLGLPMNIFLYSGAVKGIPEALDEAARIDGATTLKTFLYVIFPILKSMTATVAILSFMWTWNDFFMQMIYINNLSGYTVSLALRMFIDSTGSNSWGALFAMSTLSLIPLFGMFIIFQRYLVDGITAGAVKG